MIRLAVFDLDGTLVNSLADLAAASNYGLRTLGFPEHPTEQFRYFVGNGVRKLCERVLPEDAKEYVDRQYALFSEYYNTHYADKTRPYPGIEALLLRLKGEGMRLAVASNKTESFTREIVTHFFGTDLFDLVSGKIDGRPVKPDPAILQAVMQQLGTAPEETVMIGDSNVDVRTALAAGTHSIGCVWGFRTEQELTQAGAQRLAETPKDIYTQIRLFQEV